ncbi:tyrosine-type recombinase/integrase [Allofustis seminis]|uniref:tyrosine-type recombinase/integrase n=1 Tax=Allofustis seminis TaxID=166939 RepID=UPI000A01F416
MNKACKRADIQPINFHYLRHTHCSLLLYAGANIKYISKRLGHANTSITFDTYSHLIKEFEEQENDFIFYFVLFFSHNKKYTANFIN